MADSEEFIKIINDFTQDLKNCFPELTENFENIDYNLYYSHCKDVYPENFFNILYENEEIFDENKNRFLLPDIDFHKIMNDESLSDSSKKTIWKYLQLVLFVICNDVKDKKEFGDANYLFDAINEDDLHQKINSTMDEMKNFFMNIDEGISGENINNIFESAMGDISNVEQMFNNMRDDISLNEDSSFNASNMFGENMDADKLKDHLSGIMGGKIGSLAKEIAEEASKELGIDEENMDEAKQQDFLKSMFKNPAKLMNIVKNIGNKLEEKFKSGEIKESELLDEAQQIMGKIQDMPGLKNMMKNMGLNPNGKFDFKGMAGKMQQNMKQAKTKERMQEKLKKKREQQAAEQADLGKLNKVDDDVFVWNDSNSNPNTPMKKSSSKPTNNKKGKKKKKKKN